MDFVELLRSFPNKIIVKDVETDKYKFRVVLNIVNNARSIVKFQDMTLSIYKKRVGFLSNFLFKYNLLKEYNVNSFSGDSYYDKLTNPIQFIKQCVKEYVNETNESSEFAERYILGLHTLNVWDGKID